LIFGTLASILGCPLWFAPERVATKSKTPHSRGIT